MVPASGPNGEQFVPIACLAGYGNGGTSPADSSFQHLPEVSLWQQAGEWLRMAFLAAAPHCDAGGRLIEHFSGAGLPQPTLFCESLVDGGEDSPLYRWVADTLESVMPQLVKMRILTEDTIAIETFARRLRIAVVEARSQVVGPAQFCAWTGV